MEKNDTKMGDESEERDNRKDFGLDHVAAI